ncbi:hypothetical protein METBIDRAFT_79487 [Metschnikowia bicuspidata var. bicuspidata NRRL YB-4993]|uniref:protein-tyrosine-phosphatase n=1 Tax=Metschnikowia bicuspidata var. bicuspidata NRRL YB-4993 TaxID=869754 RepID=A0A1A0H602_9ASCO|nr:hypothetical protein METBIDRAFT_79487 [Metschnikowia bicuspidata var. bicuspidata NRRL YB-4993]OBA19461.1 hypothetical protein METBIDRAFT_79487 [Metschnikowia bicuspidata var. bicuspidata NRRL YB-4993]
MSTSPCCAEYKFPATPPGNEPYAYARPAAGPPKAPPAGDYFALKPPAAPHKTTFFSPVKPTPRGHGSGSVSSLGSEATFTEHLAFVSHDFHKLTDTLFEDCEDAPNAAGPRNVLLLSLNLPKKSLHHKARSSLSSSAGLLARHASARDADAPEDPAALSAVEPRFLLDRKYSLGVAEESLGRANPLRPSSPAPVLHMHHTLPNLSPKSTGSVLDSIKTQQIKRLLFVPPQESFRDAIVRLSPSIAYLSPAAIASIVAQSSVHPQTRLRDILVLDIRPLADHVKSHVAGAINICLPLTLLKRPSFDLKRCVNSLPVYERLILQSYFHHNRANFDANNVVSRPHAGAHGLPAIVLYDHSNHSSNIYHMCRKLVDHSCFDASSAPPIYLIDGLFLALASAHPDILGSGKVESIDVASLSTHTPLDGSPPLQPAPRPSRAASPRTIKAPSLSLAGLPTPNVSNFSLPTNLPETKFKIRHNEEMFNFSTAPSTDDKLSNLAVNSPGLRLLPQWLRDSVANNTQIRADFNKLEECEKSRLNSALKIKMENEFVTPGGRTELTPVINSGLDYGHKNRYKDIFLYEHTRVSLNDALSAKLVPSDDTSLQLGCDYINASYLKSSKSVFGSILGTDSIDEQLLRYSNCIATQGPLLRTAGDFWKCVVNQGSLVIVSLTNDVENGVEKCFAFWKSGRYMSGNNAVDVSLLDTETYGALKLRTFAIDIDNKIHHKVLQLHLDSWMDMGVAVDSNEVLAMIHLKNHILAHAPSLPEYPSVIHCSAGCGRTGVFAAADMLMNAFKFKGDDFDVIADPVYDVVNDLRRQRILMVQTIRQYGSIYGLLIHRITGLNEWQSISDTRIAKAFLEA